MKKVILSIVIMLTVSCGQNIEELETEKISQIVNARNTLLVATENNYDRYVKSFGNDPDNYNSEVRDTILGFFLSNQHGTIQYLIDELDKAVEENVLNELNSLTEIYKKKSQQLDEAEVEMAEYLIIEEHQKIDPIKRKEAHQKLLLAYDNYFEADSSLVKMIDDIDNVRQVEYLKKLKMNGEALQYLVVMALEVSKKMTLESQAVEFEELETVKLEAPNKEVQKIFKEMAQYKEKNPDKFEDTTMSIYYMTFDNFAKTSQGLYERVRDNIPFTEIDVKYNNSGNPELISGSVYKLYHEYDNLLSGYNQMANYTRFNK